MLLAELSLCQQRESSVSEEIEILTERATVLLSLATRQEQILQGWELLDTELGTKSKLEMVFRMFGGSYGSEQENALEGELDSLLDEKVKVQNAQFRWSQAAIMLDFALEQLHEAVRHWQNCGLSQTEEER